MAFNENIADRIRNSFATLSNVEEKKMMGGIAFMYNGKMCVGVIKDDLMCRIDPEAHEELINLKGCRTMDFTKRPMIGYILIDESGMETDKQFNFWINKALAFNPMAKASKKKKKKDI
jgi:TfoX/Sxy family transcriptional regulator of competence genes